MSTPCDGCHEDATHFLCDLCMDEDGLAAAHADLDAALVKVAKLREALEAMLYDVTPVDGYPSEAAVQRAYAALEEPE